MCVCLLSVLPLCLLIVWVTSLIVCEVSVYVHVCGKGGVGEVLPADQTCSHSGVVC